MDDDGLVINFFVPEPPAPKPKPKPKPPAQQQQPQKAQGQGQGHGQQAKPKPSLPPANGSARQGGSQQGQGPSQPKAPHNKGGPNHVGGAKQPGSGPGPQRPRPQAAAGGQWGRKRQREVLDEDTALVAADDGEADDIADVVAMALKKDAALEEEIRATGPPGQGGQQDEDGDAGVVNFDDDSDGGEGRAKKRRQREAGDGSGEGRGHGRGKPKKPAQQAQQPAAQYTPGHLAHASTVIPATSIEVVYGSSDEAQSWEGLGVSEAVVGALQQVGFQRPTRVQQASLPQLLGGRDVLVKAPTGSGKTLAYLVPLIQDLQGQEPKISRGEGTHAIITAPTRELCIQINDVAVQLCKRFWWLVPGMLIGGENRAHEKARLRKGVTLLAATPGRLLDHLQNTAAFVTASLRWLVLDEADRLLDLGFEPKLRQIIGLLEQRVAEAGGEDVEGARRQTVLVSATLSQHVAALAGSILKAPLAVGFTEEEVRAAAEANKSSAEGDAAPKAPLQPPQQQQFDLPRQLKQSFVEVPCKSRLMALASLLQQKTRGAGAGGRKVVVFMASCAAVDYMHVLLGGCWSATFASPLVQCPLLKLHGDMPQVERTSSFIKFSEGPSGVLLCTDVAARGLDFPSVTCIIQYDAPGAPSEYVHRVGRTARMGAKGEAVIMLMPSERGYVDLLQQRGVQLQEQDCDRLLQSLQVGEDEYAGHGKHKPSGSSLLARTIGLQQKLMQAVAHDHELQQQAADAFRTSVKAYATHPSDVKHIFHPKKLHLGHMAYSFALKDTPGMIGHTGSQQERKRKKLQDQKQKLSQTKKKYRKAGASA